MEKETFPIDNRIIKETGEVTCNMAESTLANMAWAMGGAAFVPGSSILTLGAGVQKSISLLITGVSEAGFVRIIEMPKAIATGAVGMAYKKGEKTVVPVTFRALKTQNNPAITILSNVA